MKKIIFPLFVALIALVTSCDLTNRKSDGKGDATDAKEQSEPSDTATVIRTDEPKQEIPVPDNDKAERIIAKFNQGPAINNTDYADALEYAEIYLSLADEYLETKEGCAIDKLEHEYPYNASLMQILYQGAALDKTEGGMVPMNDDNRARFEALVAAYDKIEVPE